MGFNVNKANKALERVCPGELTSKYAVYPIPEEYNERWLKPDEIFEGKPVFLGENNGGVKTDYIWCKRGPKGPGYYHILTKYAYSNLYTRLSSEGPGTCSCFGDRKYADQWDTTCRIVYNRSRASRPDDIAGEEQAILHMEGTKLNPVHGLKV